MWRRPITRLSTIQETPITTTVWLLSGATPGPAGRHSHQPRCRRIEACDSARSAHDGHARYPWDGPCHSRDCPPPRTPERTAGTAQPPRGPRPNRRATGCPNATANTALNRTCAQLPCTNRAVTAPYHCPCNTAAGTKAELLDQGIGIGQNRLQPIESDQSEREHGGGPGQTFSGGSCTRWGMRRVQPHGLGPNLRLGSARSSATRPTLT